MALEATFKELCLALDKLREELSALRVMLVEDKPLHGEVILVTSFGDAAENLMGLAEETIAYADEAYRAFVPRYDLEIALVSLAKSNEAFEQLMQRLMQELLRHERVDELLRLGRKRHGEWEAWTSGVHETLERCQPLLFESGRRFFDCWRELAEQAIRNHLKVRANVGLA